MCWNGRVLPPFVRALRVIWVLYGFMTLLVVCCVACDGFLAQKSWLGDWQLLHHLVDSGAHWFIGFCSWAIFRLWACRHQLVQSEHAAAGMMSVPWRAWCIQCLAAGTCASLLDLDHFIEAGSFRIDAASHLKTRPFGHCVTFIVAVNVMVRGWLMFRKASAWRKQQATCFVWISLLSHQLRDAVRRGLWFWPLGSTHALPYVVYLALEQVLPVGLSWWFTKASRRLKHQEHRYDQLSAGHDDEALERLHDQELQLREMTVVVNV